MNTYTILFSYFLLLCACSVQAIQLSSQIMARKAKPQVRQANIPSTIVIAMDIPAMGLKGEEKWIDVVGANEKAISHEDYMKQANHRQRMSDLEGKNKIVQGLFSMMANSQSEQILREQISSDKREILQEEEQEEKEKNEEEEEKSNGKSNEMRKIHDVKTKNPMSKDNVPKPFYNGPVHDNDLQPIYANWQLESNAHGDKKSKILPSLRLYPRTDYRR